MVLALALGVVSPVDALQSWWALPVLLLPSVLTMMGLAWLLSAFGTYLRDVANLMPAIAAFLMFLMPVFYPAEFVPREMSWLVAFNPLAWTIEALRGLLFKAEWPGAWAVLSHTLAGLAVAGAGWWTFRRVRPGFADVL